MEVNLLSKQKWNMSYCGYWNMSDFKSKSAWRDEVYVILIKKPVYQEVVTV